MSGAKKKGKKGTTLKRRGRLASNVPPLCSHRGVYPHCGRCEKRDRCIVVGTVASSDVAYSGWDQPEIES